MYYISNGHHFIGYGLGNVPTTVANYKNALSFAEEKKANNFISNLKNTLKRFDWQVVDIDEGAESIVKLNADAPINYKTELNISVEGSESQKNFDVAEFFKNTITVISQLREYAHCMRRLESEYNMKISDIRHYKRDKSTKLNAIQLQRLEQFEIKLERERYEAKSNYIIAEIFLSDFGRMENSNYIGVVDSVKNSTYKPQRLSFDLLDEIVGKRKVESMLYNQQEAV